MSFDDRLHREPPKHITDNCWSPSLSMEENLSRSVADYFNLGLCDCVLVMSTNAAECECLSTTNTVTLKSAVVKAQVVCVVSFDSYVVMEERAFVRLFGRESGYPSDSGDQVVEDIVREMAYLYFGPPIFFICEISGELRN